MNQRALAAAIPRWVAAHRRKKHAATGADVFWAGRSIDKERITLQAAYALPEDEEVVSRSVVDEEEEDCESITKGQLFDYYCVPASPAAKAFCETVWAKWLSYQQRLWNGQPWKKPTATDLLEYKSILDTVLANQLNAILAGREADGVRTTRDKVRLQSLSRYRPQLFNVRFLTVIDTLSDIGILRQVKGTAWRGNVRPEGARLTELHSTKTFKHLMAECNVADVRDTKFDRSGQEIILLKRDQLGHLSEYADTDLHANQYRAQLRIINEMLAHANITVLNRPGLQFIDDRDRFLQRQFTYESWVSGGRLKGGFWMPTPKSERHERFLINGEETIELDYNSIPFHCLYSQARSVMPSGDVYTIPGLDPRSRPGIKKLMLALTYDKKANRRTFPTKDGLVSELFTKEDRGKGARYAITQIRAHHAGIGHLLGANKRHGLQFQESQVLIAVLLKVATQGLVGLPIHDCLLVPLSQADRIRTLMETTALEVLGLGVPVDKRQ